MGIVVLALGVLFGTPWGGAAAEGLLGLAVAPGREDGVSWSAWQISSLDGARVLLPGPQRLRAVAVATDGTVFAIRGRDRLGVARPNATAVWRMLPRAGETRGLAVVADQLAWFFETRQGDQLALTADQGRHWKVQKLPFMDHGRLRLLAGGVLELAGYINDCHSGDSSVRYRGRIGSDCWRLIATEAETAYGRPTHFGTWRSYEDPFSANDGYIDGPSITYRITPDDAEGYRLVGRPEGEADERVLDVSVPYGLSLMAVDARARLLGVTTDNVWRWSPATGWQSLRPGRPRQGD